MSASVVCEVAVASNKTFCDSVVCCMYVQTEVCSTGALNYAEARRRRRPEVRISFQSASAFIGAARSVAV